ncbi:MAG: hypothetical protein H7Y11_09795 [Armatimonadetes bacterium]|nr:hypothetical protein [Anaerolineae bacterium]
MFSNFEIFRQIASSWWWVGYGVLLLGCVGCTLTQPLGVPTDARITDAIPTANPTATAQWADLGSDELAIMSGICFEAAFDAVGDTFVLRTPDELTRLYNLADNSRLCRNPVVRANFDFSGGRVLAGLWSYGRGCTARHALLAAMRDTAVKTLAIRLKFTVEGDCPYELVRPFWVGLSGVGDYTISLTVE